ncbi:shikimate kinase [Microbacterium sp. STN6]|uniref:shikimate kinase n=1 Tax=Microbacterium sp. STN6 TaxID=2995588 RepID=UPI002260F47C|nr:shikimate kinase [Microbacterium sp. STN6]MCX7521701.1 shikimate kinase [Microbacterium sp. STN6]
MSIVLIGPPAAGKSRIGKRLAARLGLPFVDTDKRIVAAHGPIHEIFLAHGEPHFRALERAVVSKALGSTGVVSLGGGAVLDRDTQHDLAAPTVILLTVTADAAASRIGGGKRPLVTDLDAWRRLVETRDPIYRRLADHTVDTSDRPLDDIARELADWVKENS